MAYTTHINSASTGVFGRFAEFRRSLVERSARYATYRKTMNELSNLSDRDLNDLGIHRSQIATLAKSAAFDI
ncbi:MAG: DUF1127 domain-containing protein [Deltaproteobacteria bacterium]